MKKTILLLILALTACTGIPLLVGTPSPPDVFVFEDLPEQFTTDANQHLIMTPSPACMAQISEPACGHGVSVILGREIYVGELKAHFYNGKPWSTLKAQSVYVPASESYAPLAQYMINACNKLGCNSAVDAFRVKLNSLNGIWTLLGGK